MPIFIFCFYYFLWQKLEGKFICCFHENIRYSRKWKIRELGIPKILSLKHFSVSSLLYFQQFFQMFLQVVLSVHWLQVFLLWLYESTFLSKIHFSSFLLTLVLWWVQDNLLIHFISLLWVIEYWIFILYRSKPFVTIRIHLL